MQYCDMGTLDKAIKRGVFEDADTGLPRMVRGRMLVDSRPGCMSACQPLTVNHLLLVHCLIFSIALSPPPRSATSC
jgi:hypothetical protein